MYPIQRASRSEFVPVRQLRYHVRHWGTPQPGRAPWVLLHGWMDVSASFQFLVDALADEHWIVAPDWRGFGLSDAATQDSFWFPDYLADLDALLDHYSPQQPVNLIGHSMGGHIATLYAGVRPARVARLVNLEGFGMPATRAAQAPARQAQWLDELRQLRDGELSLKPYPDLAHVAQRLMKTNPRLRADRADWLAGHWAHAGGDGAWHLRAAAGHKVVNPQLFREDEVLASYARITAPTLCVIAGDDSLAQWWKDRYTLDDFLHRIGHIPVCRHVRLADCGHMLHHDQPAALAQAIEAFMREFSES